MHENLGSYLHGEYLVDRFEINKVNDIASCALGTLEYFNKEGAWPYEIADPKANQVVAEKSHSTPAMNLFAMAAAYGHVTNSVIAPFMPEPHENPEKREAMVGFVSALHRRIEAAKVERAKKGEQVFQVCDSTTYGFDDPFTISWLLELLRAYEGSQTQLKAWREDISRFASRRVEEVFKGERLALETPNQTNHIFPTVRWVQIYAMLTKDGGKVSPSIPAVLQKLEDRLHQHLSYFSIPDSSFDAAELAFAMEGILLLDKTKLTPATVEHCWHVLRESQSVAPYWRPLRPFLANSQGMVLLPLSVEIASSLIRSCQILDKLDKTHDFTGQATALLKRYAQWLYARRVSWDVERQMLVGWHSEYTEDTHKIHTWETSQVLLCLLQYAALLDLHRARRSLSLAKLDVLFAPHDCEGWQDLVDTEISDRIPAAHSVYQRIDQNFVASRERADPSNEPLYSMLLYGPPGTGKSWLAEKLAARLNRTLIRITPSDFIVEGPAAVEAHAKALFDVLTVQNNVVIFFDEIDRLILDRSSAMYDRQDDFFQFMTPSMLTKLQDLRNQCRPIFIIAVNYAERIDPA